MKREHLKFPHRISEYITEHFREDFLFEVKDIREDRGDVYYTVEVAKDDYIHTLKFNKNGELLMSEMEQAFPPDSMFDRLA